MRSLRLLCGWYVSRYADLLQWDAIIYIKYKIYTWRDTDEFHFVRPRVDLLPIVFALTASQKSIFFFGAYYRRSKNFIHNVFS